MITGPSLARSLGWAAAAAGLAVARGGDGALRLAGFQPAAPSPTVPVSPAAALAVVAALLVGGPVAAGLAALATLVARRLDRARQAAAAGRQERAAALDALTMLSADLRAGRTAADAFTAAAGIACGESAAALAAAAAAARLGGDVPATLCRERSAVADALRALAACWRVCSEAGSGLAVAVERLEEGLRTAEMQRLAVEAELAGPRATAQLLAVLPLVGVALAAGLGAHPLDLLLGTPIGLGCLAVGLGLDGLGVVWTRRLTARVLP